jgi:hypothetical protein
VRLLQEELGGGVLGRECERGEGVHDEVDPEELHDVERRLAAGDGGDEGDDERDEVDGELELGEEEEYFLFLEKKE